MAEWNAMPPWVWIVIVAILVSGFRRSWHYRPRRTDPQMVVQEDPRVDDLQARVAELENRLDFTERLLSSRSTPENEATPSESGRRGS